MKKKLLILLFLLIIFLFICLSFTNSQESSSPTIQNTQETAPVIDFGKNMGLGEGNIIGSGIEYTKSKQGGTLTFNEEDAILTIKGNEFKNIQKESEPGDKLYIKSFINVDETGEIIKADFTTNDEGGAYVLGGAKFDVPPNSRVEYLNGELKLSKDAKLKEIPENIKLTGEGIKLPDNKIMSGTLNYRREGRAFITEGETVSINNVEIKAEGYTGLYFDGERHKGEYISLGDKNLVASSKYSEPLIDFKENNPYIKIEGKDYVAIKMKRASSDFPSDSDFPSEIEIQNRDDLGKIPLVTTKGSFVIDEDHKSIITFNKKVCLDRYSPALNIKEESTTSPIELIISDVEGNMKNNKIFVDNFNRIAIVPENAEEFLAKSEGIDTKFSARVSYNYPTDESIEILTGKKIGENINFHDMEKGNKDLVLGRLRNYYETLPPETKESIKKLNFASNDYFKEIFYSEEEFITAFTNINGKITFRGNEMFTHRTFRHEAAHVTQTMVIDKEKTRLQNEWMAQSQRRIEMGVEYQKMLETPNVRLDDPKLEKLGKEVDRLQENLDKAKKKYKETPSAYETEWSEIAGDVYGRVKWEESEYGFGAKKGCVREYGCTSAWEDGATFVEEISVYPGFFKDLINPEFKDTYDLRYRQKLDYLYNHKFISEEEYNNVLRKAGVK